MSQRVVRAQQAAVVGNERQVLVEHLLGVHDGPYLKEVELAGAVVVDVAGQLYFHRTLHALGTVFHGHLKKLGQGEHAVLKHSAKRNDFPPAFIVPVANDLVGGVVGAADIPQRPVLVGLPHAQVLDVETVVNLEVAAHVRHVEGVEARLRFLQCQVHFAHLQYLVGMVGRHAQRLPAVHDVFSQSQRQACHAFLGRFALQGVIVERAEHAADVGIVLVAVLFSHHFLQYHGHFLLVDDVARGGHVSL